jgi:xanthine dehydrogenase YagT iron-sulfur-binding subunit
MEAPITLTVDGEEQSLSIDTRSTLLDTLRDRLGVYAPKKGCDHGQCGSCTVLLDGRRHLTCLALAVAFDGAEIVTATGLGTDDELHPVQRAFLDHDGFQCGYCTPGQVCSAVGMLEELERGDPSDATPDLGASPVPDNDELRERMSGNLCRCGAYPGILAAIRQAAQSESTA